MGASSSKSLKNASKSLSSASGGEDAVQRCRQKLEELLIEKKKMRDVVTSKSVSNPTDGSKSSASNSHDEILAQAVVLTNGEALFKKYFSDYDEEQWDESTPFVPPTPRVKLAVSAISLLFAPPALANYFVQKYADAPLGLVHTILQIDKYVFEWNDSSLVYITSAAKFHREDAMISFDLEFADLSSHMSVGAIKKICNTIADWNGNLYYESKSRNCQHFTNRLLEDLEIESQIQDDPRIKKFLHNICNISAENPSFEWTFEDNVTVKGICTHQQLEEICHERLGVNRNTLDYRVMKAIDRMFWIRFYSLFTWKISLLEEKKRPAMERKRRELLDRFGPKDHVCYFQNPAFTATAIGEHWKYDPLFQEECKVELEWRTKLLEQEEQEKRLVRLRKTATKDLSCDDLKCLLSAELPGISFEWVTSQALDGETFLQVEENDLKEWEMPKGHRLKVLKFKKRIVE